MEPDSGPARRALLAALTAHAPLDAVERAHLAAIRALVESEPRCFARDCYVPGHLTGSAFVVDPLHRRVLLHHHRRLDRWLQLGGHDDGALDLVATALREAREESALADLALLDDAILDVDVHPIPAARGEPRHRHFDVRYALVTSAADAIRADPAESHAVAWFDLDEAERRLAEPGGTRALRRLRTLLG